MDRYLYRSAKDVGMGLKMELKLVMIRIQIQTMDVVQHVFKNLDSIALVLQVLVVLYVETDNSKDLKIVKIMTI